VEQLEEKDWLVRKCEVNCKAKRTKNTKRKMQEKRKLQSTKQTNKTKMNRVI
jgi:hypothetical protein